MFHKNQVNLCFLYNHHHGNSYTNHNYATLSNHKSYSHPLSPPPSTKKKKIFGKTVLEILLKTLLNPYKLLLLKPPSHP